MENERAFVFLSLVFKVKSDLPAFFEADRYKSDKTTHILNFLIWMSCRPDFFI